MGGRRGGGGRRARGGDGGGAPESSVGATRSAQKPNKLIGIGGDEGGWGGGVGGVGQGGGQDVAALKTYGRVGGPGLEKGEGRVWGHQGAKEPAGRRPQGSADTMLLAAAMPRV